MRREDALLALATSDQITPSFNVNLRLPAACWSERGGRRAQCLRWLGKTILGTLARHRWPQPVGRIGRGRVPCLAADRFSISKVTNCTACVASKYSAMVGAARKYACQECNAGKFLEADGADVSTDCNPCAVGKFSELSGASSITTCKMCVARKYATTKTQPPGAILRVTAHQNAQRDTRAFSGHALPAWWAHTRPNRVMDYVYYSKPQPACSCINRFS